MSELGSTFCSESEESNARNESDDNYVFSGGYLPNQKEPLAIESDSDEEGDIVDEDGLSPAVLEQRYDKKLRWINGTYLSISTKKRKCQTYAWYLFPIQVFMWKMQPHTSPWSARISLL